VRIEKQSLGRPWMPREWARVILEAIRVCQAGSRTPDTDMPAQTEIAVWIRDHYPELFHENPSARMTLP
jgi:hypothetical protein